MNKRGTESAARPSRHDQSQGSCHAISARIPTRNTIYRTEALVFRDTPCRQLHHAGNPRGRHGQRRSFFPPGWSDIPAGTRRVIREYYLRDPGQSIRIGNLPRRHRLHGPRAGPACRPALRHLRRQAADLFNDTAAGSAMRTTSATAASPRYLLSRRQVLSGSTGRRALLFFLFRRPAGFSSVGMKSATSSVGSSMKVPGRRFGHDDSPPDWPEFAASPSSPAGRHRGPLPSESLGSWARRPACCENP